MYRYFFRSEQMAIIFIFVDCSLVILNDTRIPRKYFFPICNPECIQTINNWYYRTMVWFFSEFSSSAGKYTNNISIKNRIWMESILQKYLWDVLFPLEKRSFKEKKLVVFLRKSETCKRSL